jgi:hypothetical protein
MLISLSGGCKGFQMQCAKAVRGNHTSKQLETIHAASVQWPTPVFGEITPFLRKTRPKMPRKRPALSLLQHFFFKSLEASLII